MQSMDSKVQPAPITEMVNLNDDTMRNSMTVEPMEEVQPLSELVTKIVAGDNDIQVK